MSLLGRVVSRSQSLHTARNMLNRTNFCVVRAMASSGNEAVYDFSTLKVTRPREFVVHVEMNRPEKRNAMSRAFWREMVECFGQIDQDQDCRVVVVTGAGKMFTSGLDVMDHMEVMGGQSDMEVARRAFMLRKFISNYQETFTCIEKCTKPVIAAIHNACIGGGVDMTTACDVRYCTTDAFFCIKEVDIGLAADVGTLQRLPKVIGNDSLVRELAFTGRNMYADEAKVAGLVSRVFPSKEAMLDGALDTAEVIASKSPVAVQVTKRALVYSRDHSVSEGLDNVALWNQCMLQGEDMMKAGMAAMQKEKATFSKL